jgi:hypothetical protein
MRIGVNPISDLDEIIFLVFHFNKKIQRYAA